jgi:hypothetical protein
MVWVTHAPALQWGPVQFMCFWQSAQVQLTLQVPQVIVPHTWVSVFRTHVVVSVSVDVLALHALAPHE